MYKSYSREEIGEFRKFQADGQIPERFNTKVSRSRFRQQAKKIIFENDKCFIFDSKNHKKRLFTTEDHELKKTSIMLLL